MKLNEIFKIFHEIGCWISGPKKGNYALDIVAKPIVGPKAPVIDCRVVDYSPGGACLEIWGQTKLPNRFELLYDGTKKRCRVVWSAGRRLGVAF
jgi:hypothetical protein